MPTGKLASQAGHAFLDSYQSCLETNPEAVKAYRGADGTGSKVTIRARNLGQMERALRECQEAGIPHALVVDRDHILLPHFTGEPIVTALGIGPCTRTQCRHITKRFQVVS